MSLLPLALLAITLVDNGRSRYSIVLPPDNSPAERRAAQELQSHLQQMSGAQLPIDSRAAGPRILLRHNPALGPETFTLRTAGRDLVISGGRPRGVLYGAYTLLDKLGVRWYTRDVTLIPRLPTIRLASLDEIQSPAFEYREPFFTEAFDKDWAARNRTNGAHALLDDSTGGKLVYYPFVHSFYQLLPPDKYFKDHPEYYSLIDGVRRVERGQLCLTNPEVLRLGVASLLEWIRQHPEASIYSVSQNDWEGWCECDNCRRVEQEEGGRHSGPILRFVNALAAEIAKKHPDKLLDTLAYWYSEDPPLKARPRPNVRIRLCPIGVCEAHPYESCPYSAYFLKNLRAWSQITNQLYIWHYNTNFSHYLLPFPDFDELAADIPLYRRHGVVGLFMEGAYPKGGGGEMAELRSWVMARQLWDPATNVSQAVDEFLAAVYGPAAKPLRAYFDLLHRQVRDGRRHLWINPVPDYPGDFLRQAAALFRQAEDAATGDRAVLRRVQQARLSIDYLDLLRAKTYAVRDGRYGPADPAGLQDRFRTFLERVRGFGITSLHEGRDLSFDEQEFAGHRAPRRVLTLENDSWRLDLAPELSGRVLRMIDKRAGRDLLRRVDSGERGYPDLGGLGVFAYPDYYARPWEIRWDPDGMTGALPNGLRLRRRIILDGATVRTETVVSNPTAAALEVVLQSRIELDPGPIDSALVRYRRQDGVAVEKRLIEPERPPQGSETYAGPERPDGEWRLGAVVNRFPKDQVERCLLSWTAKGPDRVTLALWSAKRRLAPGQSLRLDADYSTAP